MRKRILTKAYGVLFKIEISGNVSQFKLLLTQVFMILFSQGGKFDFVTFILKIGSMIALLSIVTTTIIVIKPHMSGLFFSIM